MANVPILYALETQKTKGFLVFSGGIKWKHWPQMRLKYYKCLFDNGDLLRQVNFNKQANLYVREHN